MKIYYDEEVDAAYIELSDKKPEGVIEISEGINIDVAEIVGFEILDASRRFPLKSLFTYEYSRELVPRIKKEAIL